VSRERIDSAIVYTETGLEVVSAPEVPRRTKLMTRRHAEQLLEKLNADEVTADVAARFGREDVA
jgi:hypothetical protein